MKEVCPWEQSVLRWNQAVAVRERPLLWHAVLTVPLEQMSYHACSPLRFTWSSQNLKRPGQYPHMAEIPTISIYDRIWYGQLWQLAR